VSSASEQTTLQLLKQDFPKQSRISITDLACVLGLKHAQSIRNSISNGQFKVKTYLDGSKRWCDLRDLAAHLDEQRGKRKVGRPSKAELLARAAAQAK